MIPMRPSLAVVLPFLLLACSDDPEVITADDGKTAVVIGTGEDGGLGEVDLPRPAWLPGDFPLPRDAHIFITVTNENQTPPIYMIQARTHEDGEKICDTVVAWAKARGLDARRLKSHSDQLHLATFGKGNGLDNASLQVHDQDTGINTIILAVERHPWG